MKRVKLRGRGRGRFLLIYDLGRRVPSVAARRQRIYGRKQGSAQKQCQHESCDFRVLQSREIGTMRPQKYEDDNESLSVVAGPAVKIIKFDVVNVELKARVEKRTLSRKECVTILN